MIKRVLTQRISLPLWLILALIVLAMMFGSTMMLGKHQAPNKHQYEGMQMPCATTCFMTQGGEAVA